MSKYARDIAKYKGSDLYCVECKTMFPIARCRKQRKKGHIKDLYCFHCKKVTKHFEVRSVDFTYKNVYEASMLEKV